MSLAKLIPDFPRQIGILKKFQVNSRKELNEAVKKYNGKKRIIYSLYNLQTHLIDKIIFDMDSEKGYDNARKFREYCKEKDMKHMIVFSGAGFHFYVFAKPKPEVDQKILLDRTHRYIAKTLNMSIGRSKMDDLDEAIVGDINRCMGMPGTYNTKRRRWARSLPISIFEKGIEAIHDFCKPNGGPKGKFKLYIYGENLFEFGDVKYKHTVVKLPKEERDYSLPIDDKYLQKKCPPCVISMLTEKGCWQSRFYASLYLKEIGYGKEDIDKIAQKYFSQFTRSDRFRNNYEQYRRQQNVLPQLFEREDEYFFPKCETLFQKGFCPGKCKFCPIEKKLYRE